MGETYLSPVLTPKEIQELLCVHGIGVVITGKMDGATRSAVRDFQAMRELEVDGIVGPITTEALCRPIVACSSYGATANLSDFYRNYNSTPTWRRALFSTAYEHNVWHPREIGGDNRGPWVRLFSNGKEGGAWCAWWATYVVQQAYDVAVRHGVTPGFKRDRYRTGWCPTLMTRAKADARLVTPEEAVKDRGLVRGGMLFLVWNPAKGRVSHTGIVMRDADEYGAFGTLEGNTNDDGNHNGFEVAQRVRTVSSCYFVDLNG